MDTTQVPWRYATIRVPAAECDLTGVWGCPQNPEGGPAPDCKCRVTTRYEQNVAVVTVTGPMACPGGRRIEYRLMTLTLGH